MGNKVPFGMVRTMSTYLISDIISIRLGVEHKLKMCGLWVLNFQRLPLVPLQWFHKLCWCIIIWDVEPETMRNSSWNTLTETKRVSTDKICTFSERIIQGVEEKWGGWAKKVLDVLLKGVDLFPRWIFCNLSIVKFTTKNIYKRIQSRGHEMLKKN